jgi:branched-chain amino acid transport system ATP-binding protein
MGISQVMEGRRIFAELTVDENLQAGAYTNKTARRR